MVRWGATGDTTTLSLNECPSFSTGNLSPGAPRAVLQENHETSTTSIAAGSFSEAFELLS